MKIALIPNFQKDTALAVANEAARLVQGAGHEVYVHRELAPKIPGTSLLENHRDFALTCDLFLAVGGDGTIIHAARHAAGKPILGINVGRLGYMAGLEVAEIDRLPAILEGDCNYEERMLLEASVNGKPVGMALNDAVISGELSKLLDYDVQVEDCGFHYRADGLIVSTPTGSTAYSLSAGGPVVDPTMRCMIFTPICPHSLFNRSVIFRGDTQLSVKVNPRYVGKVYLTLDGERPHEIKPGEAIGLTAAQETVKLMLHRKKSFFDVVNRKLLISDNIVID